MDSVPNSQLGIELCKQLSELWKLAGVKARKWLSNSAEVMNHIPIED
jgi:hypothetical protein